MSSGQKQTFGWYANWRNERFTCVNCGWTGKGGEAFPDEVGMMECPQCDRGVGFVEFPSLNDTEKAAALGNKDAIRDLTEKREWAKRLEIRMKQFESGKLRNIDQLPELQGDSLEFIWDLAEHVGEEDYQIICLGNTEIWRELAFFGNTVRFNEIKNLLKQKYGSRFRSLTPTAGSLDWLTADHYTRLQSLSYT
jgi:hypothetical protein